MYLPIERNQCATRQRLRKCHRRRGIGKQSRLFTGAVSSHDVRRTANSRNSPGSASGVMHAGEKAGRVARIFETGRVELRETRDEEVIERVTDLGTSARPLVGRARERSLLVAPSSRARPAGSIPYRSVTRGSSTDRRDDGARRSKFTCARIRKKTLTALSAFTTIFRTPLRAAVTS